MEYYYKNKYIMTLVSHTSKSPYNISILCIYILFKNI